MWVCIIFCNSMTKLSVKNLSKIFAKKEVLKDITLSVSKGEVVGLIGGNGSGKTTLINILSGFLEPDTGSVLLEGRNVAFSHPRDAIREGIHAFHQDLGLCPDLNVVENIYLGREPTKTILGIPLIDSKNMKDTSRELLSNIGGEKISHNAFPNELSGGQQKLITLAKFLIGKPRFILLDEPTAALAEKQKNLFLQIVKELKNDCGIILVSHDIDEVAAVTDRVLVLQNGTIALDSPTKSIAIERLREYVS